MSWSVALPWPPRILWPNGRGHWASKARAVKHHRRGAYNLARGLGGWPVAPAYALTITAHPPPRSRPDDDGVIGACKSYRDGLADAFGVDDRNMKFTEVMWGARVAGGEIVIEVSEIPASTG